MTSVTTMNEIQYAASLSPAAPSAEMPQLRRTGARSSANAEAPNAADRNPADVTPICTAARNRFGSACSSATFSPRRPRWASDRTWPSRREMSAISEAEKKPATRRKNPTSTMPASVEFTPYDQGRGMPVWSSRP